MADTNDVVWKDGDRGAPVRCRRCSGVVHSTGSGPVWMRCVQCGAGHEYVVGGRDEDPVRVALVKEET